MTTATATRVRIRRDPDPQDPRDGDNVGTMACFHRRYTLGDKTGLTLEEARAIESNPGYVWLPIYMMDHSGLTLDITPDRFRACDPAGWDWGRLGIIFVEKEKAAKEGIEEARLPDIMKSEVETYSLYLEGRVYGFEILDDENEVVDSCWGFYGEDWKTNGLWDYLPEELRREDYDIE